MAIGTRLGIVLLALLLHTAVISAQQNVPPGQSAPAKINLDVVVTAKSGPPVAGLQQQDFTLLDNKARQPITSFHALGGSQAPIEVVLFIDTVNITYDRLAYARGELDKFLRADGGHLAHPTAIAVFADTGTQIQEDFSSDGNGLSAALDSYTMGLRSINRSEGFYGAAERFQLSINALQLLATHEASRPGRKIVLWVSPGWPLLSGPNMVLDSKQQQQLFATIVNLSTQLRQAGITLYSIDPLGTADAGSFISYYQAFVKGVSKPSQVDVGNLGLQVLAVQSGGLALNSSNDIVSLLQKCLADTGAYYELSFDPLPAEHRDEYHHIEIKLAKPGFIARTREGYYAQP